MKACSRTFHFTVGGGRRSLKVFTGTPVEDIKHAVKQEYAFEESIRFDDTLEVRVVLSHARPDSMEFHVCTNAALADPQLSREASRPDLFVFATSNPFLTS
jgi:hypothetical protein